MQAHGSPSLGYPLAPSWPLLRHTFPLVTTAFSPLCVSLSATG
ncbi:hypothetical protein GQ607_001673 [Colletotrichum asianum]|uniref:Uncharacterized protein n=1 Tax=Colletotrichum asianum TaxID=702518 RepID=A0A8H3ZSF6_9PEZI|nr:hypothetical protein GQ607_001673 [Colletotrichum asianum]